MPSHPFSYRRRTTREVRVGDVGVGGTNPIRVQSMTTPATTDVAGTVAQIERLVAVGCEIVRVTVPSKADAEALPAIRRELAARGVRVPLVADIHFTPAAAMLAVEHVEKVRVNPGNFADKKRFASRELSDDEYTRELARIADRFLPLVRRAQTLGVAMRIGTNHGSLSDRIMTRFGDTALGMVESALEFARLAAGEGYHEIIISMKSSNALVAIDAYRQLVAAMDREDMRYPLHLGVTEAGDGEDARIKSAIGIGALLDEGLGDTVRVSLTEDPVLEIPVASALVSPYNRRPGGGLVPDLRTVPPAPARGLAAGRRKTRALTLGPLSLGGDAPIRNEVRLRTPLRDTRNLHWEIADVAGWSLPPEKKPELLVLDVADEHDAAALVALRELFVEFEMATPLAARLAPPLVLLSEGLDRLLEAVVRVSALPPRDLDEATWTAALTALAGRAHARGVAILVEPRASDVPHFLRTALAEPEFEGVVETAVRAVAAVVAAGARGLAAGFTTAGSGPSAAHRLLAARLDQRGLDVPLIGIDDGGGDRDPLLAPSIHLGAILADGIADAIRVDSALGARRDARFAWDLLQAARQRVVKTEYIACPSCGRTLFDLETTTQRIRAQTSHLKGLKIAIMGCVVNGPGEMADADFGYVGWGPQKVALFAGKTMVAKDVPEAEADRRLIELIQSEGRWLDAPAEPA